MTDLIGHIKVQLIRNPERNGLPKQFASWSKHYRQTLQSQNSGIGYTTTIPVVFICAEGGALRTGAYTSLFLTKLQDRLKKGNVDFKHADRARGWCDNLIDQALGTRC